VKKQAVRLDILIAVYKISHLKIKLRKYSRKIRT